MNKMANKALNHFLKSLSKIAFNVQLQLAHKLALSA